MLAFDQFAALMTKLRFKDDMALKEAGLGKLAKTFDAYPLLEGGKKVLCLLPKGMDSNEARKLSHHAAAAKVVVLQEGAAGLAKVWPGDQKAPPPKEEAAPPAAAELGEIVEE